MRKLSTYAWTIIFIVAIFAMSITAAVYYSYGIPKPAQLRIFYVHSPQMVSYVTNDFKVWYQKEYGNSIEVTLMKTDPQSALMSATHWFIQPQADIWWGGPLEFLENASEYLLSYNSTYKNEINETCHNCPLMDLNQSTPKWYAANLYGLGVMYNEWALNTRNLQVPQNWTDLLKQEYEGNITMVDPAQSQYTQSFIMLMLQSRNWAQGWESLINFSAFISENDSSEDLSTLSVASGFTPLAVVPDFAAYDKMLTYPNLNFTYLDATVLQPDPVAIINQRTTNIAAAKAFIDYILTERAQNIIGEYCLPIRQDVTVSSPKINPFDADFPYVQGYNETFEQIGTEIVKAYYQAWITENHEQIKTAWDEIKEANDTTHYYQLAWNNFTYAGYYMSRNEVDVLYNETNGWTQNTTSYIQDWQNASTKAYSNAITNAQKSKENT